MGALLILVETDARKMIGAMPLIFIAGDMAPYLHCTWVDFGFSV